MANKQNLIILIAVVVVLAISAFWYVGMRNAPAPGTPAQPVAAPPPEPAAAATTTPPSLGEKIYEQSQNPIEDKVPTTNPVVNPIEGAYKNPFQ